MRTTSLYKTPAGEQAALSLYNAALRRWPVPHETMTLATRHGDTFIVASGHPSSPPMVLLHGAGMNSAVWARDIAAYSHSYRTYAVDLLGEAGQSAPSRPAWSGPAFAEWLDDILGALKLERTTLLGMSQGAWVALKFAIREPGKVEGWCSSALAGSPVIGYRSSCVQPAIRYSVDGAPSA
jgi:pimeloyl-ACP methyl ester carboxylesterase